LSLTISNDLVRQAVEAKEKKEKKRKEIFPSFFVPFLLLLLSSQLKSF